MLKPRDRTQAEDSYQPEDRQHSLEIVEVGRINNLGELSPAKPNTVSQFLTFLQR